MQKVADFIVERKKYIFLLYAAILVMSVYGIFNVNVNYDMSAYLPDDSATKEGLETMTDEFVAMSNITVMFEGLSESEQLQVKKGLEAAPNVKSVIYMQDDEKYQKEDYSKYEIALSVDTYSREAQDTLDAIREMYGDRKICISGAVMDNGLLEETLMKQIPPIAVVAVIIIFIILFLMCDSWIEPFLYMTCIGVAILINMGTNALLPSVSFMTFAIGALLQLGLSMDYSIMLMNRYMQEKREDADPGNAMKRALAHSFGTITSSSFTTIVGLLALVFMSFKIGQDMGVVLAKGVFISLLCIFTLLPGLVVAFDKLIMKTHKKALPVNMKPVMKGVYKIRFVIVPLVIVVVIAAFLKNDDLLISFVKLLDNPEQEKIEEVFGIENQTVLLYKNSENAQVIEDYIGWLEEQSGVNAVQDYANTIGKRYTYVELAEDMDMDVDQARLMYQMYKDKQNTSDYEKTTMYDLICYMDEQIAGSPMYADFMSEEEIKQITDARDELEDGKQKIADGKKEIADGEKEIADGEAELAKGEAELKENEKKINESEAELIRGEAEIAENEQKLADGERQISEAEAQMSESEKQLADGEKQLAEAEAQMAESEKQLTDGEKQLAEAEAQIAENEKQLTDGEKQLAEAKEQMETAGMNEEQIKAQLGEKEAELQSAREQLEAGKKELNAKKAELQSAREQLEAGKKELNAKKAELQSAREQLEAGRQELAAGRQQLEQGRRQISDAKKEINKARSELENGRKELEDGKKELAESREIYDKAMTAEELADVMDQDISDVEKMLMIRRMSTLDVEEDIITLEDFINFVTKEVLTDETYAGAITAEMHQEIKDGQQEIQDNKSMLIGNEYNRMLISTAVPVEGEETFALMESISGQADKVFEQEYYLVGDSAMGTEMNAGFSSELNFVTLLTVIAIFLVVILTFRSVFGSAALVVLIQSAVYITTAIVCLQGIQVNYIALILVQCILMGATIDYGILLMSNYREARIEDEKEKGAALGTAMNRSIRTILTSSLILIVCCLSIGLIMTQKVIAQICMIIAYGAICSVIMVAFVLPAVLVLLDKFLVKRKRGRE